MVERIDEISREFGLSGCALKQSPSLLYNGVIEFSSGDIITMMPSYPFNSGWGISSSICLPDLIPGGEPVKLYIIYLSLFEGEYYGAEIDLRKTGLIDFYKSKSFCTILIGMGPFGRMALWSRDSENQNLIDYYKVRQYTSAIAPHKEYIKLLKEKYGVDNDMVIRGEDIDKMMKQYVFKFIFVLNDNPTDNNKGSYSINIKYESFDGSSKSPKDTSLLSYSYSGIPKRIRIDFCKSKSDYNVYYWLSKSFLINIFEKFYGTHPETKTDFIIRIDAENKQYELALYRQGLKEPVKIPESAYQLIVFKNKFEDYRSENYNQPRGAWTW